jgi:hypothetical protein
MHLAVVSACLLLFADPPARDELDPHRPDPQAAHARPVAPASAGHSRGSERPVPHAEDDPDATSAEVAASDSSDDAVSVTPEGEVLTADRSDARDSIVEHWEEPEFPLFVLHGAYSAPVGPFDYPDTQRITQTSGFDVGGTLHVHPRVALRLQFHRDRWETQGDPARLDREDYTGRRVEFLYGLDLLGLPYQWRVRPSLSLYGGGGVNWANSTRVTGTIDPVTGAPAGAAAKDKAITLGAVVMVEAGLHVALKKVHFAILGGISKPFMAWKDGFVGDADGFTEALRFQVGLGIGFPFGR